MSGANHDPELLRRAAQAALDLSECDWYRYLLRKNVSGRSLSDAEERAVIDGATRTAATLARQVTATYGRLSPPELAAALGLKVAERPAGESPEPYLYLALYEPAAHAITLNEDVMLRVRRFIEVNGLTDLTHPEDIPAVALFHEIFHALEEETPDIYTRSRMLNRKALGLFPYRRGLDGASEVGAVHFSREMAGLAYCPCIFERYLLLALGQLSIDLFVPNV
jgi:hypothetical protein